MQQYELSMRIIIHNVYYTNKDYGGFIEVTMLNYIARGIDIVTTLITRHQYS